MSRRDPAQALKEGERGSAGRSKRWPRNAQGRPGRSDDCSALRV